MANLSFPSVSSSSLGKRELVHLEPLQPDMTRLSLDVSVSAEYRLNIREPGSTKAKPGLLAITLETKFGASANAIAHNETAHASSSANISSSVTTSSRIESANQDPSVLAVIVQNADKSVALLHTPLFVSNTADIVDHGATASSSDSFNTALSIMGNLIKFGDVLSEVSLRLELIPALVLNTSISVSSLCKVGLEHPNRGAEGTNYLS
jgi:hypothetical protein